MAVGIFWCITLLLIICALSCVLPPIWFSKPTVILDKTKQLYALFGIFFIVGIGYGLYYKFGTAAQLSSYYAKNNVEQRREFKKIRPLYAKLQRELVKNKMNLDPELSNIDLILHFAKAHSQVQSGILDKGIKNLLQSILKVLPQQVTALNLLAVDAYKTKNYSKAIEYWQLILQQFTPDLRGTELELILKNKIDEAAQLCVFESRRTN